MNTLKQTLFLLLVLVFSGVSKTIAQSTGVYVGGHIRRERPGTCLLYTSDAADE